MSDMHHEIKELIINSLSLEDISPADIVDDEPLFVEGLGLDSIDALELGVEIKKKYNIIIDAEDTTTRDHFYSVSSLAKFIEENRS